MIHGYVIHIFTAKEDSEDSDEISRARVRYNDV